MIVQHNLSALNANRQLGIVSKNIGKTTEHLSSGYCINRAADNAAGLSISEKMRKQIRGLTRASQNCEDGVSLCQVADGALNETHDILQRINELAIQSANGTNSSSDRECIDREVQQLIGEVDRIANTTVFNEAIYPLKQGRLEEKWAYPLKEITMEDVTYDKVHIIHPTTHAGYEYAPFRKYDGYNHLDLRAVIDDVNNEFPVNDFSLLYGKGGTSGASIRLYSMADYLQENPTDLAPTIKEISLNDFTLLPDQYTEDLDNLTWSRSFQWRGTVSSTDDITINLKQTVSIDDTNKNYIISNSIGFVYNSVDFDVSGNEKLYCFDFLQNLDTAYSDNDYCEGYYINGEEITTSRVYESSHGNHLSIQTDESLPDVYDSSQHPDSISIANTSLEASLPFTQKFTFPTNNNFYKPVLSIANYYAYSYNWAYYSNDMSNSFRNSDIKNEDKALSMIWTLGKQPSTAEMSMEQMYKGTLDYVTLSYTYGLEDIQTDTNLPPSATIHYKTYKVPDYDADPYSYLDSSHTFLKIQAGSTVQSADKIRINLVDATAKGLGLVGMNTRTEENSLDCIDRISDAIHVVSKFRSNFGSKQNRLEHTISNLDNIVENTTASESQIRDTNMATEMVNYSNSNILIQSGYSVLSQANQNNQKVLTLIA